MAFIVNSDSNYEQPTVGMHQAVCVFVEDIGTQITDFGGHKEQKHQMVMCFEIDQKLTQGDYAGKPFMVSKFYTVSLHVKSTLSKDLQSWFGKAIPEETRKTGFDLETLIGKNCMLNLTETNTGRIKIDAITPPMANMAPMKPVCTVAPAWISKMREKSLEAQDNGLPDVPGSEDEYNQTNGFQPQPSTQEMVDSGNFDPDDVPF